MQFHVGPRAGSYGSLEGTSLAPMAGLIRAHRDARFDISHSGFPYLTEAAVLAKTCENVFLNLSWMHIYSPEGCVRALREWIRMVPINKIIGFGDDLYWVDSILGHLVMARQNVAHALAGMMIEGLLTESDSVEIGRALFNSNPAALYGRGLGRTYRVAGTRVMGREAVPGGQNCRLRKVGRRKRVRSNRSERRLLAGPPLVDDQHCGLLKRRVHLAERSEVGDQAVAWCNEEVAGARTGADELASLQSHATFPQPVGDPRQSGQRVAHR
ncbi:MAG: hypothetical protein EBT47_12020, partial [Chloroflexi bacterium]|nr:hypothetical protein [Chloroflexota bacterium]